MVDVLLRSRDIADGKVDPNAVGKPLVKGAIGFVAYATTSNPTAEALSSTTDATAGHVVSLNAIGGVTVSLTAGTIAVPRDGNYLVELVLTNVTAASNSGVFLFAIQKNAAALTNVSSIGWTNAAAILPGVHGVNKQTVALVRGDLIRAVFTGSVGGIVTIGNGSLSVEMQSDATAYTQV